MRKETARTLMIVVGVLILFAVLGLASALWLFASSVDVGKADAASARQRFDEIRQRFGGVAPVLHIRDGEPVLARRPPAQGAGVRLSTMRIVHWDPGDDSFSRIDLPFWLLRLKSGPIEIVSDQSPFGDNELGLTVEELERYGPTLVLDHEDEDGGRVLIWTE